MHICGMKCILLFYFNVKSAFISPNISIRTVAGKGQTKHEPPQVPAEVHICPIISG